MNQEKFFNKDSKTNKNKNFNRDGRSSQWQDKQNNQKRYDNSSRFNKANNRADNRPNDKFNKTNKTDRVDKLDKIDKTFNKEGKREFKPKKNFNDYIPGKDDDRIEDLSHRSKKRDSGNKKKNDFSELEGMLSAKDKNRNRYENNKRKDKKKKNDYDDWDDGWN